MRKLQDILDDIPFETLPPAWTTFDLAAFSHAKRLWDYQQQALQNATKALWKYYEDFGDYSPSETTQANADRKGLFFTWYRNNGLEADLDLPVENARRDIRRLLEDYYPVQNGRLSYEHLINRISFWMATGSGKTLVIVKLCELLWRLIRLGEIPPHDVLVLTHRDDLIEQLRLHVNEFNTARSDVFIRLRDLRDYPDARRVGVRHAVPLLFGEQELTLFYYRSDNLSDEQKERIVDFRNYDNEGRWYILLDEAHKGDKEDSKRQHIYSILARNGFLFNFSATFTDPRDMLTTAYDFNLARFIEAGYGKHISVLRQENRAFRDDEDYTGAEKQKIVLKALIMLAYARKAQEALSHVLSASEEPALSHALERSEGAAKGAAAARNDLYHRPLLLALVNSVNTQDADLKLFFRELERIGKGDISQAVWQQAKTELWGELQEGPELMFEGERFAADERLFQSIALEEVLACVYNAPGAGATEVLVRPSNRQELAFKLKSAERPFGLIKIGDISDWLKEELAGYEVNEGFEDEGFFERLNADDSDINILMGSRSFYEGWDSNRPNVITFINIGTGTDARKFILQAIGRGVRIEPVTGQRKRLAALYNARAVDAALFHQVKGHIQPLETLFIFGTNRNALLTVIQQLDLERGKEAEHELALQVNEAARDHTLLIPIYRRADRPLIDERDPAKFPIANEELAWVKGYVDYLADDRILLARHNAAPRQISYLRRALNEAHRYFKPHNDKRYGHLALILPRLLGYFDLAPEELDRLKPLEDEIRHFRHVKVLLKDISELQAAINQAAQYPKHVQELREKYEARQLSFEQFLAQAQGLREPDQVRVNGKSIQVRRLAQHYYHPLLLADDARADYIRHIIHHPSEAQFVQQLEDHLQKPGNGFARFDWWLFSKLDETLDQVYLPYYDPEANRIRRFNPDFIFWLQKDARYLIVFVDPKGMQLAGYQHKIDGYKRLFCDPSGGIKTLSYNGLEVRILLLLHTDDANKAPQGYREYWFDSPTSFLSRLEEVMEAG